MFKEQPINLKSRHLMALNSICDCKIQKKKIIKKNPKDYLLSQKP